MNETPIIIEVINNDEELDRHCWSCKDRFGQFKEPDMKKDDGSCETCDGKGFELTPNGRAIMDLIKRHG